LVSHPKENIDFGHRKSVLLNREEIHIVEVIICSLHQVLLGERPKNVFRILVGKPERKSWRRK
jgi:hypothetical protein